MSTPHPRGEVSFEANGKPWKLKFSMNVICDIEAAYGGLGIQEIASNMQEKPSVTEIRRIFAFGLKSLQPDVTERAAGEIIDDIGFLRAAQLLNTALQGGLGVSEGGKTSPPPAGQLIAPTGSPH